MKSKKNKLIKLSTPFLKKNELKYAIDAIKTEWISTAGQYINSFENKINQITKSKHSIACINGTAALHISLKLVGVKTNDEVLVPSVSFVAPINAVRYLNASPIFFDSDNYHNINLKDVKKFITENTYFKNGKTYNKKTNNIISAIIIVHVWGNAVNLNGYINFFKRKNVKIIEDASESLGTKYKKILNNQHTGLIGDIGCISFNANKIITTGGGGAIITNNSKYAKKARYYISQSKDDSIFFKHNDVGYNYKLTNINAAIGLGQIEQIKYFIKRKKQIYNIYHSLFLKDKLVNLLPSPNYAENNHWMNVIVFDKSLKINLKNIINYLFKINIEVRPVWFPNHLQKEFKRYQTYNLINVNNICKNSLCIPSSMHMTNDDIKYVYLSIKKYLCS